MAGECHHVTTTPAAEAHEVVAGSTCFSPLTAAIARRYRIECKSGERIFSASAPTRSLRFDLFKEFRVGEILRAAGLPFVADEVITRDDPDLRVVEARRNPTAPRASKVNAIKVR